MAKKPAYKLLDHTADSGIHVFGDNAQELFQNAAGGLMDQIVETVDLLPRQEKQLTIEGTDWPDLMVNWLREILYLWAGDACLVQSVQIKSILENRLVAHVWVDPFAVERHRLKSEIKAVTYHQIEVLDLGRQWEAKIIFDT